MRVVLSSRQTFDVVLKDIAHVDFARPQDNRSDVGALLEQEFLSSYLHVVEAICLAFAEQARIGAHVDEISDAALRRAYLVELPRHVPRCLVNLADLHLTALFLCIVVELGRQVEDVHKCLQLLNLLASVSISPYLLLSDVVDE